MKAAMTAILPGDTQTGDIFEVQYIEGGRAVLKRVYRAQAQDLQTLSVSVSDGVKSGDRVG